MNTHTHPRGTPEGDQQKAFTPDKVRNDDPRWKDKDMPEQDDGKVTPSDYEVPPSKD
ncbi:hypothetical protein [Stenotrophomonas rhizophila]|uniref:hypothetical protein n=1 Tax=Stenotrophomonas rhizophila TaxID=216778 RepID=UPI0028D1B810|nr:hypothetical protein [Stenotrophomonas rhizophila]